ncbi:hypothetical protein DV515_00002055, partial [Chloebia gouldiae]
STRVALNHLESVPEKLSLVEDCRDTGVRKISFDYLSTSKIFWLLNNLYECTDCLIRYLQLHMYESHCRREMIEERYMRYKDMVTSLQQQLEDSKQRVGQVKDVKMDAEISDVEMAAHSSSWRTQNSFLCSSLLSSSGFLDAG